MKRPNFALWNHSKREGAALGFVSAARAAPPGINAAQAARHVTNLGKRRIRHVYATRGGESSRRQQPDAGVAGSASPPLLHPHADVRVLGVDLHQGLARLERLEEVG